MILLTFKNELILGHRTIYGLCHYVMEGCKLAITLQSVQNNDEGYTANYLNSKFLKRNRQMLEPATTNRIPIV